MLGGTHEDGGLGMRRKRVRALGAMCAAVVVVAGGPAGASGSGSGKGVCDGVRRCHEVAHVDVNGDGEPDAVGVARRGRDGAEKGKVVVRVKTGPDEIVSTRRKTSYWYGSPWQGASHLDGEPGKDLMVGYMAGAHTLFFHGLTWRDGGLVTLDAPGRGHPWVIDGAYNIAYGWMRKGSWPEGHIRKRVATRYESEHFKGTVSSFRWKDGSWDLVDSTTIYPLPDKTAYSWAGFHVPGLRRYE